jgi:manganese oxidase
VRVCTRLWRVARCDPGFAPAAAGAVERTYFIAADEVVWDFAPSDPNNPITGEPFTREESVFLRHAKDRIGRKYLKAVYREYTGASFTTPKPRGPAEESQGIMGPIIHAEVGDTITVVFRNNTRFPVGIHPHGVFYAKASEGAHYVTDAIPVGQEHDHGAMPETGAHVKPKGQYTYPWEVPDRAGPGPSDPSSIVWLSHAHDQEGVDIYAGLVGAIIVTRSGGAQPDGAPKDVDREFVILFMIIDENMGPYLDANIRRFAGSPKSVSKKDSSSRRATRSTLSMDCSMAISVASPCAAASASAGFGRPRQRERYPHRSLAWQYGAAPGLADRYGRVVSRDHRGRRYAS